MYVHINVIHNIVLFHLIFRQASEFERQSEKWAEVKRNLEEQFHAVQNELRNQEMAVSAKQKGKVHFKNYVYQIL